MSRVTGADAVTSLVIYSTATPAKSGAKELRLVLWWISLNQRNTSHLAQVQVLATPALIQLPTNVSRKQRRMVQGLEFLSPTQETRWSAWWCQSGQDPASLGISGKN